MNQTTDERERLRSAVLHEIAVMRHSMRLGVNYLPDPLTVLETRVMNMLLPECVK